jgi:acetyl-CoA synthetase
MATTQATAQFLRARETLLARREDYEAAYRTFIWPQFEAFNWALDYFDVYAAGNQRPALIILDEDGPETRITFETLRERTNRVANFLRHLGVQRGERILLMLGNQAPLWELTLAAMKLGAVVSPAATALTRADLEDRVTRGRITFAVTDPTCADKLEGIDGLRTKLLVGERRQGWACYDDADTMPARFDRDGPTCPDDPFLLYFTSGTTAKPKMVLHTHTSYPVGHLSTMYWIGLREGTRTST